MEVSEAILKRESIRAYTDRAVDESDLAKVVEAGRLAPNAGPFKISVIYNKNILKKINDSTLDAMAASKNSFLRQRAALPGYQPLYGAPVLILLSGPAEAPYSAFDTALAAQNMLLQATDLGLGSCYLISPTLILNEESGRSILRDIGVPDSYSIKCAVITGYSADDKRFCVEEINEKGAVDFVN